MVTGTVGKCFPKILSNAWSLCDPTDGQVRVCDALARDTYQRRFTTLRGDYWICSETGQMARAELIDAPTDTYDEYWQERISTVQSEEETLRKHAVQRAKVHSFEKYRKTGRLFEVGSGLGTLLRAANELGWNAEGNELSPLAARYAETIASSRVISGPIEQVRLEAGVYDVILVDNVFEHLLEPRSVLLNLASALHPGGVMYLNTLNAQSLSLWWNPRDWYYFVERHYFIPTRVSMRQYFADAGLTVLSCRTHGFTPGRSDKFDGQRNYQRTWWEKPVGSMASLIRLGHRIEFVVQRSDSTTQSRPVDHHVLSRAA